MLAKPKLSERRLKAGLEPATSRLWSDNPILRPVEIAGVHNKKLGQETASDAGLASQALQVSCPKRRRSLRESQSNLQLAAFKADTLPLS